MKIEIEINDIEINDEELREAITETIVKWFPNNMAMMQLADYLIENGVTVQDGGVNTDNTHYRHK